MSCFEVSSAAWHALTEHRYLPVAAVMLVQHLRLVPEVSSVSFVVTAVVDRTPLLSHVVFATQSCYAAMPCLIRLPQSMMSSEGRPVFLVVKRRPRMTQPSLTWRRNAPHSTLHITPRTLKSLSQRALYVRHETAFPCH
ncbi:unnamed protein product [Pylaiella littoralis]